MILIDFSQIVVSRLYSFIMKDPKNVAIYTNPILQKSLESDINMFLRMLHSDFGSVYGDIVVCMDSKNSWRKQIFPEYKIKRKKEKDQNPMWDFIHDFMNYYYENNLTSNLKLYKIDTVEADDIIAYLVLNTPERHVIISRDKDFYQLHSETVVQYDFTAKEIISNTNKNFLKEHIIRGDTSDGIPNILSDLDTFAIEGKRQRYLYAKNTEALIQADPSTYPAKQKQRYDENKSLISLFDLPQNVQDLIRNYPHP